MHPVWVQKIEDARRKSVMLFWGSMFFVVVLPILIMFRADFFMLLAIICFGAAGVRAYMAGSRPQVSRAPVNRAAQQALPAANQAVTMQPGMQAQTMQLHMSGQGLRPQPVMIPAQQQDIGTIAQQPSPQPAQSVADGFFKVSLDPGQPLIPQGVLPEAAPAQAETAAKEAPAAPVEEEQPVFASMHFHDIALGKRTPPTAAPEQFQ